MQTRYWALEVLSVEDRVTRTLRSQFSCLLHPPSPDSIHVLVPSSSAVLAPECHGQDGRDLSALLATPSPAPGTARPACGSCLSFEHPLTSVTDEGAASVLQMGKPRPREVGVTYSLRHDHGLLPQGVEGLGPQALGPHCLGSRPGSASYLLCDLRQVAWALGSA